MEKIDLNATREAILKAYREIKPEPGAGPKYIETIERMKRAAPMIAEVQVFCLQEIERAEKAGGADLGIFAQIGEVLATALHSPCESVHDDTPVPKGEMAASHTALHILIEALDRAMHDLHYATADGRDTSENGYHRSSIEIVRRDVGDA